MHAAKSLKKNHIVFSYNKEKLKNIYICISMHFGFNNQFIKVKRIGLIFFLKKSKNILFCFLLVSGVMTLYIRRISNIKFFY
jgi:hypothetical protein